MDLKTPSDGRYIVLHPYEHRFYKVLSEDGSQYVDEPDEKPPDFTHSVHGGWYMSLYKTRKMALKAARDGATYVKRSDTDHGGIVLMFDASLLPVVATDKEVFKHPGLADKLSEEEFCERQIMLWHARMEKVRNVSKP